MNVLIACHCKHTHMPVYLAGDIVDKKAKYYNLYDADELAEAKRVFGIANIDYIEKRECQLDEHQHREWHKLPRKYDIIVSVHCPVYGMFHDDKEYKYIDFMRAFYKDVKDNLKPGGFFHLPYNRFPKSFIKQIKTVRHSRKSEYFSLEDFNRHNSNENIIKVMHDILGGKDFESYKLEIIDYKNRARLPFFIDTDKHGTWSTKSTFRHLVISFPRSSNTHKKTKKHIRTKYMSMKNKHSSKTRKHS